MALTEDEVERLSQIIATLSDARSKLNTKSRQFFDDVEKRYDEHGADLRLSPAQWKWLESLMEQHG